MAAMEASRPQAGGPLAAATIPSPRPNPSPKISLSLCEQLIYFVLLLTACNNNGCWTPHVRRFTEKKEKNTQLSILLVNWFNAASMDGSF
jgi:hypothetical protein